MKKIFVHLCAILLVISCSAQSHDSSGSYFKSADGIRIYYETKGTGRPVLLVHGFMGSVESWKKAPLYAELLSNGFQVIALDLRGNGKSDKPHNLQAYLDDAEAKDIMQLANLLQLKSYSIVGYSRGAIIASRVLVLDKKVDKAVIGGMGTAFMDTAWPRRKMFYSGLLGQPVKEMEGVISYIEKNNLDRLALAYSQGGQPSTTKKEFVAAAKPVLVICGDKDDDHEKAKELAALIPGSIFESVPGDHNNAMRTKEFSLSTISFLSKN